MNWLEASAVGFSWWAIHGTADLSSTSGVGGHIFEALADDDNKALLDWSVEVVPLTARVTIWHPNLSPEVDGGLASWYPERYIQCGNYTAL